MQLDVWLHAAPTRHAASWQPAERRMLGIPCVDPNRLEVRGEAHEMGALAFTQMSANSAKNKGKRRSEPPSMDAY